MDRTSVAEVAVRRIGLADVVDEVDDLDELDEVDAVDEVELLLTYIPRPEDLTMGIMDSVLNDPGTLLGHFHLLTSATPMMKIGAESIMGVAPPKGVVEVG